MLTPAPFAVPPKVHPLAKQVVNAMQPTAHGLRIPAGRWDEMIERLRNDREGTLAAKSLAEKALELDAKKCRNSSEQLITLIIVALGAVEAQRVLSEAGLSRIAVNSAILRAQTKRV